MATTHTVIEIKQQVDQPIAKASGLPNERYISDESFISDRDNVIGAGWACIAFIDDLPEANYALPVDFMGLPLLITRDKSDIIRVFHNVCSHRGMHLADAPCKTNGMVRCPYHSWTYSLDGSLRGTPHIGGFGQHDHPDFEREKHGLKPVRSNTWLGAIFVNLSGEAAMFDEYIAPLTKQFNDLTTPEQRDRFKASSAGCRTTLTVDSNWKLAVENYLESYHLPTVHPELNRVSPLNAHFELEYFNNGAGQGSLNYKRLKIDDQLLPCVDNWPEEHANRALYPALYPNTLIGLHADQLFIMYLQPVGPDKTIEHVRVSYVGDEALSDKYAALRETTLTTWTSVFGEDVFAVERMQKGRSSPGYQGGAFSPAMDKPTLHFHQWVAKQLVDNSPA